MDEQAIVAIVALVISEILSYLPVKSSGIVQLLINILKGMFAGNSKPDNV